MWEFSGDRPIYLQLMDRIKMGILSGEFPSGERLPSVRDLAAQAGVNPNTMQRALAELEREGYLCGQRTSGRSVSTDSQVLGRMRESLAMEATKEFLGKMRGLGMDRHQVIGLIESLDEKEGM